MGINMGSIQAKIQEYTRKLSGDVSLHRLFPCDFLSKHSQKENVESLFLPAGIVSQEAFDAWCGTETADAYIKQETDFESWDDMLSCATKIFLKEKQEALREGRWKDETFATGDLFKDIHIFLNFSAS